jgi:alkylated DNA repair dioxygenase AlkB
MTPTQAELFGPVPRTLPQGFHYRLHFVSPEEEAELLAAVERMTLEAARYRTYSARRRVASYGTQYDFQHNRLLPGDPLPAELVPLRERVARWIGVAPEAFTNALVAEYRPGTPLGWHRDVPDYEMVVGISLAGIARMRFRRYPPIHPRKADVLTLELEPRSAYVMRGEARWEWQHSVAPTPALRYSITFRTPAERRHRPPLGERVAAP